MGLCQLGGQRQGALQGRIGGLEHFRGQAIGVPQPASMDLGQFRPSHRIGRVDADRLLEQRGPPCDFVGPATLCAPAGSQIELIGLRVARAANVRRARKCAQSCGQHGQQRLHDPVRDLILHFEHAGELLVEGAAPGCDAVSRMQQAGGGAQLVAAPLQRAVDDPTHIEFPRGAQRVLPGAGIGLHRACGAHYQPGNGGEPGDQAVGHAEFEQLVAAFCSEWLEGQDCQGGLRRGERMLALPGQPTGGAQRGNCAGTQHQAQMAAPFGIHGFVRRGIRHIGVTLPDDGRNETKSVPGHRLDEAAALGFVAQRPPQARHHLAQVVHLDDKARPERLKEGLLVEQFACMLDEELQCTEQARREFDRLAVRAQHPPLRSLEHELTESVAVRIGHGADSTLFQEFFKAGCMTWQGRAAIVACPFAL